MGWFEGSLVIRFGTMLERLAASKETGTVEEYVQVFKKFAGRTKRDLMVAMQIARDVEEFQGGVKVENGSRIEDESYWRPTSGEVTQYETNRYNPGRSGVAEWSEAIEDQLYWGRTSGEGTLSEANRYDPGRSGVAERSEANHLGRSVVAERFEANHPGRSRVAERSEANHPGRSGATESVGSVLNTRNLPDLNRRGQLNPNRRGLPDSHGRELLDPNGREPPNPNGRGQPEPNGLIVTVKGRMILQSKRSPSHWRNGLTIRMKAGEGKVDGRTNAQERRRDSVKRWTNEKKKGPCCS
ncbi:hypothetical protein LR48_Vigan11g055600 [Vigna angularis]|uniref:Uncharacterized protein n=1 Tax=Phaseolus angularis TaxID=3914 RepID=A0A0L9VRF5_PHAAN|nr:hypothetical protein LR48_Vigan11g055600 [Vigna angularis]